MEKILHPAATTRTAKYSWLQAKYWFRFQNYFDSSKKQVGVLQILKDAMMAALAKVLTPRDTIGIWNTKNVSMTTKNDIHVLLIEIPIK